MNSDTIYSVLFVGFISFVIYVTKEQGDWSIKLFMLNLIVCGFVACVLLLIGSLLKGNEAKGFLFVVYVCIMSAYLQNARQSKIRKEREREALRIEWENYQAWYNSLSEFQKLQVDNERLREENAVLSR